MIPVDVPQYVVVQDVWIVLAMHQLNRPNEMAHSKDRMEFRVREKRGERPLRLQQWRIVVRSKLRIERVDVMISCLVVSFDCLLSGYVFLDVGCMYLLQEKPKEVCNPCF